MKQNLILESKIKHLTRHLIPIFVNMEKELSVLNKLLNKIQESKGQNELCPWRAWLWKIKAD